MYFLQLHGIFCKSILYSSLMFLTIAYKKGHIKNTSQRFYKVPLYTHNRFTALFLGPSK